MQCGIWLWLLLVAGCGLSGRWQYDSLEPEIARREMRLFGPYAPGETLTDAVIVIHDDQTYSAEVRYGDEVQLSSGRWERSGERITFVPETGGAHTYDCRLAEWDNELELQQRVAGTDVVITFERVAEK
jgi:hypothetical protein